MLKISYHEFGKHESETETAFSETDRSVGDVELSQLRHACLERDAWQQAKLAGRYGDGVLDVVDVELGGRVHAALVIER